MPERGTLKSLSLYWPEALPVPTPIILFFGRLKSKALRLPGISVIIRNMSQCIIHGWRNESRLNDNILGRQKWEDFLSQKNWIQLFISTLSCLGKNFLPFVWKGTTFRQLSGSWTNGGWSRFCLHPRPFQSLPKPSWMLNRWQWTLQGWNGCSSPLTLDPESGKDRSS